jgi:hypothetical protein
VPYASDITVLFYRDGTGQMKGMRGKDALGPRIWPAHAEAVEKLTVELESFSEMIMQTSRVELVTRRDCPYPDDFAQGQEHQRAAAGTGRLKIIAKLPNIRGPNTCRRIDV